MAKKYMYRLFGLNILSEIKFDGVDEYKFEELDVVINQKEKLEDDKKKYIKKELIQLLLQMEIKLMCLVILIQMKIG